MSKINWNIIRVAEVRREGYKLEDIGNYFLIYYGKTEGQKGIGFLVNRIPLHKSEKNYSNSCILQVNIYEKLYNIIQACAPTPKAPQKDIESMYVRRAGDGYEQVYRKYNIHGRYERQNWTSRTKRPIGNGGLSLWKKSKRRYVCTVLSL